MPFSLGQMLGGFKKKDGKGKPRAPESSKRMRSPASSSTLGVESPKTPSVFPNAGKVSGSKNQVHSSDLAWSLIVRPHISEKSTMLGEGKYILKVASTAKKGDLKRAVGDRYGVEVEDVKILNMPSKKRRRGGTIGTKPGFKKAIITLAKGQLINEF